MRFKWTRGLAIASIAMLAWGCEQAPRSEVDAAHLAYERARSTQAAQYARDAMREAERAKAALDHEMQAQARQWLRWYGHARELALEARAAAERASAAAMATRDAAHRWMAARRNAARRPSRST